MINLRARLLIGCCTLPVLLAGCGSQDAAVDTNVPAASTAAPNPNAEFTAAVTVGNTAAPARVQFRLGARPAAGEPLPVSVRVLPTANVDRLQVFFETEPGVAFVDESQSTFVVDRLGSGTAHSHELQVLPQKDGIYLLKVTVMADSSGSSKVSEFAIPLLVGSTPPPAAPAPATPPAPAGG